MKRILLTLYLITAAPAPWAEDPNPLDPLQQAAAQGNPDAQYEMGILYEFGFNRPKDNVTALAWYMLAGAQGNVLAAQRRTALESRLTPAEVEAARELAERLTAKKPTSETVQPAETSPATPVR